MPPRSCIGVKTGDRQRQNILDKLANGHGDRA
jgi:hypothetical protein